MLIRIPLTYIFTLLLSDGVCVNVNEVCASVAVNSSATSRTDVAAVTAAVTKAVVAIVVVLSATEGVGAVGVPVNAGEADNTVLPVPVEEVTPVPPLAIDNVPVTPVVSGNPVRLVATPEAGVPNAGVTRVGEVSITNLEPVPVWEATEVVFPELVIGPVKFALVVVVIPVKFEPSPTNPVAVKTPVLGTKDNLALAVF